MVKFFHLLFLGFLALHKLSAADDNILEHTLPVLEQPAEPNLELSPPIDRFYSEFFKMMFFLGLIVLFLFLLMWFLRRMMRVRIEQVNTGSALRVIEKRALTPKTTLFLIAMQEKQFLVAESLTGGATLLEVSDSRPKFETFFDEEPKKG